MQTYTYRIVIEPDEKGYHGFVPLLKGVHTSGKTLEETKKNLQDAIQCHLEGLLKDNITPPKQSDAVESIQTFSINA
ncbi:MAG: type II toxin-antitoxin system HicB family antitoxin [bacterium]|nr:type II toxin-antitoxin system HicB family antitoxin [bacterium]